MSVSRESQRLPDTQITPEITTEKFANFLVWLSPNREAAGEAYERLRFRLCRFFSQRNCSFADELADETINRVIVKVGSEPIGNKMGYCYGVAKNVFLESLRKKRPQVDIDEVTVAAIEPVEEPQISHECLDKCLASLPSDSRNLLLDYFSEAKRRKIELHRRISQTLQKSQTAVRMQVMRTKQKLKVCVEQCMNS
jgi:RNA polymerase sigma factor (sigma-70 family)